MHPDRKRPKAREGRRTSSCLANVERLESRTLLTAVPGNMPSSALNIGALTTIYRYHDTLTSTRTSEYFKFSLTSTKNVGLSLTSLTADANLQIARDKNGDGIIQSTEVLATSAHTGTANESIGVTIGAGTYYVRVYEGANNASYNLTIAPHDIAAPTLHVVFNYSYDTAGFFAAHPQAKTLLDMAASSFKFTNSLSAIVPSGSNTWSETFSDPAGSTKTITIKNPTVAANTVVIYVGGAAFNAGAELGHGGPGGYDALGSENWIDTVTSRGQSGALLTNPTGFGPWGGSIAFSSLTNWNFSTAAPTSTQNDFLSVATHEIAHVLGFGTADSWKTYVSGNTFVGPHVKAANAAKAVTLSPDLSHWAAGTYSTVNGVKQLCEMDPTLTTGTRRALTVLDLAGLEDVGWKT